MPVLDLSDCAFECKTVIGYMMVIGLVIGRFAMKLQELIPYDTY